MKRNTWGVMMTVSLVLGGPVIVFDSSAVPRQISNSVTTTRIYPAGVEEIAVIQAWIQGISPGYGPLGTPAEISITNTEISSGVMTASAQGGSPPTPLPSSGAPGQTITIVSTFPNGGFESWTYTWSSIRGGGGAWTLSAYEYKKGNLNLQ